MGRVVVLEAPDHKALEIVVNDFLKENPRYELNSVGQWYHYWTAWMELS